MALAVAASPAVPVSALVFARALGLACGLGSIEPAAAVPPPSAGCGTACVASRELDASHASAVRRARIAMHDGAWNEAAEQWREALLIDGRKGEHWLLMGDVLLAAERHREAVAAYQRAIQVDARLARVATRNVARAYARMGNDRQAVRWLEQALRLGVRSEDVWAEPAFERYRGEPRLHGTSRQIDRRGAPDRRSAASRA